MDTVKSMRKEKTYGKGRWHPDLGFKIGKETESPRKVLQERGMMEEKGLEQKQKIYLVSIYPPCSRNPSSSFWSASSCEFSPPPPSLSSSLLLLITSGSSSTMSNSSSSAFCFPPFDFLLFAELLVCVAGGDIVQVVEDGGVDTWLAIRVHEQEQGHHRKDLGKQCGYYS